MTRLQQRFRRAWASLFVRGWRGTFQRIRYNLGQTRSQQAAMPLNLPSSELPSSQGRPRLLVIESLLPDSNRDSGSMRLCMMLQLLHRDGWHVDLTADDGPITQDDAQRLLAYGIHVSGLRPYEWLRTYGSSITAVLLCRLGIAEQYLPVARNLAAQATVVFDTVDLHFLREQRAAQVTGSRPLQRYAARSRSKELRVIAASDICFVVSPIELALLQKEVPNTRVAMVSNIHLIKPVERAYAERSGLLFVGGFGHPPNEDAMRWFCADILPSLLQHEPALQLHIVGDISDASRAALNQRGVMIHGRVDDLAPLLQSSRVSIAPLRFGAGVKGKVNLAMSHGLPVVVTPVAAEGMHIVDGEDALVRSDASAFAEAVLRVYRDQQLWEKLSRLGQANVRQYFSPELAQQILRQALPAKSTP